jgi:3-oxosteroid 1-dehydrogenase
MIAWDESRDFVVVGSGGGAMAAGLAMRNFGKSVILLEKTDQIGGSTAMSGGVMWIPNHPLQRTAGVEDSYEAAMTYLDATVGDVGPSTSRNRKAAYLRSGPRLVQMLLDAGVKLVRPEGWADYYDERPGGCPRSRSLIAANFDVNKLGPVWSKKLRRGPNPFPVGSMEVAKISVARSLAGWLTATRLGIRMTISKLRGQDLRSMGGALQGRVMKAGLDRGVEFRTDHPVTGLISEGGRVTGVEVSHAGAVKRIEARLGVLIAAGGFEHNREMRRLHQPDKPQGDWASYANPGNTGDLIEQAQGLGAAVDLMDETVWIPSSRPPGRPGPAMAVNELGKPHIIVVNKDGVRFMDEAASYMEVGQRIYANGSIPSYMIFDDQHRSKYLWGMQAPGITPSEWFDSGYFVQANTLEQLAAKKGLPEGALRATVERFNRFARAGNDEDFRRGLRMYDRVWGDHTHKPNPGLGTIEKAPFYCVDLIPGDVGTFGGILTDEHARVVRDDGSVVQGLYATGNCTASVMGRTYPAAGASIGASFVFGMIAAEHAAGHQANAE